MDWFDLPVSQVDKINGDAVTITLDVPHTITEIFKWQAGQHVRMQFLIDRQLVSRNYSISSAPGSPLQLTVKKVENGLVSSHLNTQIKSGDTFQVTPPMGRFVLSSLPSSARQHVFFAAGSGITPIYAMLHSLLEKEPLSTAVLLYGNKSPSSTIFATELAQLQAQFTDRLTIYHSYSATTGDNAKFNGRINPAAVAKLLALHKPSSKDAQYYICGPGDMLITTKQALLSAGVADSQIHSESFGVSRAAIADQSVAAVATVYQADEQYKISVKAGQTLLEAMVENRLNPAFSCQAGVCGECRCKLLSGKVAMGNNLVLDQDDLSSGDILACQAVALTTALRIILP